MQRVSRGGPSLDRTQLGSPKLVCLDVRLLALRLDKLMHGQIRILLEQEQCVRKVARSVFSELCLELFLLNAWDRGCKHDHDSQEKDGSVSEGWLKMRDRNGQI